MQSESPFQSVYDLGSLLSVHPVKWAHRWGNAVVGVLLVGIGIGSLVFASVNALPPSPPVPPAHWEPPASYRSPVWGRWRWGDGASRWL